MCGIAGYFNINNPADEAFQPDELQKMLNALEHRGPDNNDYYANDYTGIGHTRLSIIDLSNRASQPMHSRSNRYVIVYNGEVYNFKEIATELKIDFRSDSDTEVILEAFEEWGVSFVNKLRGMFAFAIYDKYENQLYLYRDRIGIKPLFYHWDGTHFAFASELKAIRQLSYIENRRRLYRRAINDFLYLGYIPQPSTIYQNIFKFPAGHLAIIHKNSLKLESYWKIDGQIRQSTIKDEEEAKTQLHGLVNESVKYRMISDVPFGTFLSGGIDSSLVTAVAQSNSTLPINTFSIGFKEAKYNEASHAKAIASYLGTNHHEFMLSEKDAIGKVNDIITSYDEPFADSSAIPTMLVSEMARKHVTMALSGDGGDEQFMGYGAYIWARRLNNPAIKLLRKPIGKSLSLMGNRYKRASSLFLYKSKDHFKSHIFSQEQYFFTREELDSLLTSDYRVKIKVNESFYQPARDLTPAEKQALFDLAYYLRDDLLVKVDRASMLYSLETRVPLLDHKIVRFSLNLDESLKIKNGVQKYLLKQVLYDYVPQKFFNRPKWGFSIPLMKWLKTDLKYLIDEHLSEYNIRKYGIVNYQVVEEYKKAYFSGRDYYYNRLWQLVMLHAWLRKSA